MRRRGKRNDGIAHLVQQISRQVERRPALGLELGLRLAALL